MKGDGIGDRMKRNYEDRTRYFLPRRTYILIRIDGKAFHTYTRGLDKPYDVMFNADMDVAACYLLDESTGGQLCYVQSDEISLLLTDFAELDTQGWFDNNLQKLCSVSASLVTAKFNQLRPGKAAAFDARVFSMSDPAEVANYFVWRTRDCVRNSIAALAQSRFSCAELHGKNASQMQDMLILNGINWTDQPERSKNGRLLRRDGTIEIPRSELYGFYRGLVPTIG